MTPSGSNYNTIIVIGKTNDESTYIIEDDTGDWTNFLTFLPYILFQVQKESGILLSTSHL
jgi:hypothetical protein